jgi:uncharacterized protein (DUF1015 family)
MTQIQGLVGHRPTPQSVTRVTAPPYDVVKPGTPLETLLKAQPDNLWHVTLGPDPLGALRRLTGGAFVALDEPSFLVYEQTWAGGSSRIGVFAAVEVTDYPAGNVIRHEKVFDDKVQGRLALTRQTGLTLEPVFLLTRAPITPVLTRIAASRAPDYAFASDFAGHNDLHGIANRVWLVPQASAEGAELTRLVAPQPLYIADGHHRYHAALLGGQSHCLAYVVERAAIQAYNRVVNGVRRFDEIRSQLALKPADWATPPKHAFRLYHRSGCYELAAQTVPTDCVGRLDCSILERELYPLLGLQHHMIKDPKHFDYYPEWELPRMRERVEAGDYDLAIALHPVSLDELMAVADAGRADSRIVMPEKSTFFAPKILSGLVLYRHRMR